MPYKVLVKKRVLKNITKPPAHIQQKLVLLIDDLKDGDPVAHRWPKTTASSRRINTTATLPGNGLPAGAWRKEL